MKSTKAQKYSFVYANEKQQKPRNTAGYMQMKSNRRPEIQLCICKLKATEAQKYRWIYANMVKMCDSITVRIHVNISNCKIEGKYTIIVSIYPYYIMSQILYKTYINDFSDMGRNALV